MGRLHSVAACRVPDARTKNPACADVGRIILPDFSAAVYGFAYLPIKIIASVALSRMM